MQRSSAKWSTVPVASKWPEASGRSDPHSEDAINEELPKAIFCALAANFGIAVCKFGAAAFTGSGSMFAEAIHSTADCGNQLLLLFGLKRAQAPANALHPLGSGREIYLSTSMR